MNQFETHNNPAKQRLTRKKLPREEFIWLSIFVTMMTGLAIVSILGGVAFAQERAPGPAIFFGLFGVVLLGAAVFMVRGALKDGRFC